MKNMRFMLAAAGSALIFSLSPIAFAQHSPGLVRVDLSSRRAQYCPGSQS